MTVAAAPPPPPDNQPPTASAGGPYSGTAGQAISFTGSGSDPDSDPLTFSWAFSDGGSATGASASHTFAAAGNYTATLTVSDGKGGTTTATAAVAVTAAPPPQPGNHAPTAQAGGPYSGTAGQPISFGGSAQDIDGDTLTYAWAFSDGGSATGVSASYAFASAGSYTATLTVSDGKGGTTTATAAVAVTAATPGNQPPTARLTGPLTGTVGQSLSYDASTSSDPDGDPLTYAWTFGDGGTASGTAASHVYAAPGTYAVVVTVNDGAGHGHTAQLLVKVNPPPNRAPLAVAGGPYSGEVSIPVSFSGAGSSDPDGDALTYAWDFGDQSSGSGAAPTHAYATAGTYTLTLTVSDAGQLTSTAVAQVTIAPKADRAPPIVALVAPREALPGASITITVQASDNDAVASVVLTMDGEAPTTFAAPPYSKSFTLPSVVAPGATIHIGATATDASGNAGQASASVSVAGQPDNTPPTITLTAPAQAVAGATATLSADAQDNAGVTAVVFAVDGVPIATVSVPPYVTTWTVPANAAAGASFALTAQATDGGGLSATANASLTIVATAPEAAPPTITLTAPATVAPGETIGLSASATGDPTVASVAFSVDGAKLGTLVVPPYAASYVVPAGLRGGATIRFDADVIDGLGRTARASKTATVQATAAPGQGVVFGRVFDDTTGLAIAGASVTLLGSTTSTTTDLFGRYVMTASEGPGTLRITRDGWSRVDRPVAFAVGNVAPRVFDARLTALTASASATSAVVGGTITQAGWSLVVPAGALTADAPIALTVVGGQGLQGRLPLGWSPVGVIDVGPRGIAFAPDATLKAPATAGAGGPLVLARWDETASGWRAVATSNATMPEAPIISTGQYAWLRADALPAAPAMPADGALLAGVAAVSIPDAATAVVSPDPRILFYSPGARSVVSGNLTSPTALPSGTPITLTLAETYRFVNGSSATPEQVTQDLVAYQRAGSAAEARAVFPATPSLAFDAIALQSGVITASLFTPRAETGAAVIGAAGGTVDGPSGEQLVVLPGAAPATPIVVSTLAEPSAGLVLPAGVSWLAGAALDFTGELAQPGRLSVPKPAGLLTANQTLLVRVRELQGQTQYLLAARARIEGDRLVADTTLPGSADVMEGVRQPGRYVFLQTAAPLAFTAGGVSGVTGQPFAGAHVTNDRLAVGALSTAAGRYAQAMPGGPVALTARDEVKGDAGTAGGTAIAGLTAAIDLSLVPQPPSVVSITPADGATSVALSDPVVVRFSEPIAPATLTAQALTLTGPSGPVAAVLSLASNDTIATLRPTAPLDANTAYTVTVAAGITDVAGYALPAAVTARFTSLDTTPPPAPPAGSLSATIPDAGGRSTVSGTQGTAGLRDTVTIVNVTRKTTTPALVQPDGGFSVIVPASLSDRLRVVLRDQAGNETVADVPRFRTVNADGSISTAIDAAGGQVEGPGGLAAVIKPGAFPDGAVVTLNSVSQADYPVPLAGPDADFFAFERAFSIDFGGAQPQTYVDVSIPAPPDAGPRDRWILLHAAGAPGPVEQRAVDTARVIDGRVATSSPPCPGVMARGVYSFIRSKRDVGVASISIMPGSVLDLYPGAYGFDDAGGSLADRLAASYMAAMDESPFATHVVCLPVLSGRATISSNEVSLKVAGTALAGTDASFKIKNVTRGDEKTLPRSAAEYAYEHAGRATDTFTVTLLAGTAETIVPAAKVKASGLTATQVLLRIDAGQFTPLIDSVRIQNTTTGTTVLRPRSESDAIIPMEGSPGDGFSVEVISTSGAGRLVSFDVLPNPPALASGNLVLRVVQGTIDPTQKQIDEYNAAHPTDPPITGKAVNRIELVIYDRTPSGALAFVSRIPIPLALSEAGEGGFEFAFDGVESRVYELEVGYDDMSSTGTRIPTFRAVVRNRVTGEVLRVIEKPTPAQDRPLSLGSVSADPSAPVLIAGPARAGNLDPTLPIAFTFSAALAPSSVTTGSIIVEKIDATGAVTTVAGTVRLLPSGVTAVFEPTEALDLGATYRVTLGPITGTNGNPIVVDPAPMEFTTGQPKLICAAGMVGCATSIEIREAVVGTVVGNAADYPLEFRDVEILRRATPLGERTFVYALSGLRSTNKLFAIDVTDTANPIIQGKAQSGSFKRRITIVPDATVKFRQAIVTSTDCLKSGTTQMAGPVAITTAYNDILSTMSFFDLSNAAAPCTLSDKILTVAPSSVNLNNQSGTIKLSGARAAGVAAFSDGTNTFAYAAIDGVGLMAADVGANTPEVPEPQNPSLPVPRPLEPAWPGRYEDVAVAGAYLMAVEREMSRLDVLTPTFGLVAQLPLPGEPRALAYVGRYPVPQGQALVERNLVFIATARRPDGTGANSVVVVDVTTPTAPVQLSATSMPGIVRGIGADPSRRRIYATGERTAVAGQGQAFFVVDGANVQNNGAIVWKRDYPGPSNPKADALYGFRIDARRGLAYLTHTAGIDILSLYDNCCDLGLSLDRPATQPAPTRESDTPVARGSSTELIKQEREALSIGIGKGLAQAQSECVLPELGDLWSSPPPAPGARVATILEQGSGACVWIDGRCDATYQPGLSDHDFEVFIPQAWFSRTTPATDERGNSLNAAACVANRLNVQFRRDGEAVEIPTATGRVVLEDVTFFPMAKEEFERATLNILPPAGTGGSDDIGDGGLGRQSLLLKWLLEGEYVFALHPTAGRVSLEGVSLDAILQRLRSVVGIPEAEGHEWTTLQRHNLYKSKLFVRVRGFSDQRSTLHGLFLKQIHDGAKATLRAAFGSMTTDPVALQLLLRSDRGTYRASGCFTPNTGDPGTWAQEPCESFEEYVVGRAVANYRQPSASTTPVFSDTDLRLLHEAFVTKSDLRSEPRYTGIGYLPVCDGKTTPCLDDAATDELARRFDGFVRRMHLRTKSAFDRYITERTAALARPETVPIFGSNETTQRAQNVAKMAARMVELQRKAYLEVPTTVFNRGIKPFTQIRTALYRNVGTGTTAGTGTMVDEHRIDLQAGYEGEPANRPGAGTGAPLATEITPADRNLNDTSDLDGVRDDLLHLGTKKCEPANPCLDISPGSPLEKGETILALIDLPDRVAREANRYNNAVAFTLYALPRAPITPVGPRETPLVSEFDADNTANSVYATHTPPAAAANNPAPLPFPSGGAIYSADPECAPPPSLVSFQSVAGGQISVVIMNASTEALARVVVCSNLTKTCKTAMPMAAGSSQTVTFALPSATLAGTVQSVVSVTGVTTAGAKVALDFSQAVTIQLPRFTVRLYDNTPAAVSSTHVFSRYFVNRDDSGNLEPIVGATADGAEDSVRIEVKNLEPGKSVFVRLLDPSVPASITGGLGQVRATTGAVYATSIMLTPDPVGSVEFFYTPPDAFVRPGNTLYDGPAQERAVQLSVQQDGVGTVMQPIQLRRPPVFLVHGLFGNYSVYDHFQPLVPEGIPPLGNEPRPGFEGRFDLFSVGGVATGSFRESVPTLLRDFAARLAHYRPGFAVGKFDVVGHSMGGVLTRLVTNERADVRAMVRKVITINSPLRGSELADKVAEIRDQSILNFGKIEFNPFQGLNPDLPDALKDAAKDMVKVNWCYTAIQGLGRSGAFNVFNGAVDDLGTPLVNSAGTPTEMGLLAAGGIKAPTHSIVTTLSKPDLFALSFGAAAGSSTLPEVGAMWYGLGLACNLTPDRNTVTATTLVKTSAEAIKTLVTFGASAWWQAEKFNSSKHLFDQLKDTLKSGMDLAGVDAPEPVFTETENDRVVSRTSQLGGLTTLDPAVTFVDPNDHQQAKITKRGAAISCVSYDLANPTGIDGTVRDINGDGLPDPVCRVIDLLERSPRSPLFTIR